VQSRRSDGPFGPSNGPATLTNCLLPAACRLLRVGCYSLLNAPISADT
jgi:hypothetical protein